MRGHPFLHLLTFLLLVLFLQVCTEEFDGFRYSYGLNCREENVTHQVASKNPASCFELCKQNASVCKVFMFDTQKKLCYIATGCQDPQHNPAVKVWQACSVQFCSVCRTKLWTCDSCANGTTGPDCKIQPIEFKNFHYKEGLDCPAEVFTPKSAKPVNSASECHQQCLNFQCKGFVFHPVTKACFLNTGCSKPRPNPALQMWSACEVVNCETCKKDVNTCDSCWHGAKLPDCIMASDGYEFKGNFDCLGDDIGLANGTQTTNPLQCRESCEKETLCKLYTLQGSVCRLKNACNVLKETVKSAVFCKENLPLCNKFIRNIYTQRGKSKATGITDTKIINSETDTEIDDKINTNNSRILNESTTVKQESESLNAVNVAGMVLGILILCFAGIGGGLIYKTRRYRIPIVPTDGVTKDIPEPEPDLEAPDNSEAGSVGTGASGSRQSWPRAASKPEVSQSWPKAAAKPGAKKQLILPKGIFDPDTSSQAGSLYTGRPGTSFVDRRDSRNMEDRRGSRKLESSKTDPVIRKTGRSGSDRTNKRGKDKDTGSMSSSKGSGKPPPRRPSQKGTGKAGPKGTGKAQATKPGAKATGKPGAGTANAKGAKPAAGKAGPKGTGKPGAGATSPKGTAKPGAGATSPKGPGKPGAGATSPKGPGKPGAGATSPKGPGKPGAAATSPKGPGKPGAGATSPKGPAKPGAASATSPKGPGKPEAGKPGPKGPGKPGAAGATSPKGPGKPQAGKAGPKGRGKPDDNSVTGSKGSGPAKPKGIIKPDGKPGKGTADKAKVHW